MIFDALVISIILIIFLIFNNIFGFELTVIIGISILFSYLILRTNK